MPKSKVVEPRVVEYEYRIGREVVVSLDRLTKAEVRAILANRRNS